MKRFAIMMLVLAQVATVLAGQYELISDTLTNSKIYPGTTHALQVYVPEKYNGQEPACLYVGLDGVLCNAPTVIDTLIAQGKMPVTIGVFLQPGMVHDAMGNVVRYNRSNEFDRTSTFRRISGQGGAARSAKTHRQQGQPYPHFTPHRRPHDFRVEQWRYRRIYGGMAPSRPVLARV